MFSFLPSILDGAVFDVYATILDLDWICYLDLLLWIDRLNHGFELLVIMERSGVIESVINILSFCIVRDIFFVICVIESIVLHRSYSLFPILFMFFSLLQIVAAVP